MASRIIKWVLSIILLGVNYLALFAQDTLRVMQYNLLYHGSITSFCTSTNNYYLTKEGYLRTILQHTRPDIFTVNEISNLDFYQQRIITNVFAEITKTPYSRARSINVAGSSIVNQLYFNNQKLTLRSQEVIQSATRDIDLYSLYYNSPALAKGDTTFIHCIVAHLKSGNTPADQASRSAMTLNAMNYLKAFKQPGNYLFMGDLNLYSSFEPAYQDLLNFASINYRFYDPVNQPGDWSNNGTYASIHTQSTRTISEGCHSTGGLDDRFDFILISNDIRLGLDKVMYVPGSYMTIGQDGRRFNQALTDWPTNVSAPQTVIEALFQMSDHLPVMLSLAINQPSFTSLAEVRSTFPVKVVNPVGDELVIYLPPVLTGQQVKVEIISMLGEVVSSHSCSTYEVIRIAASHLRPGFYIITIHLPNLARSFKVVKM